MPFFAEEQTENEFRTGYLWPTCPLLPKSAGYPFRNLVRILRPKLLRKSTQPLRVQQEIVDGRVPITVHGIREDPAIPAYPRNMPSVRSKKFLNDFLNPVYSVNMDGIGDETF